MSSAPYAGPVVPYISSSDLWVITAGTNTEVTLTGVAFTNLVGAYQWISDVSLTAADGSSTILSPDSITQGSLAVTIPGTTPTGNYTLQAVKGSYAASNPVVISIKPEVVITDVERNGDILFITGSGFGDDPPEGAEEYLNVEVDGVPVLITGWTDTEITASVSDCDGTVTVNALFGSDTDGEACQSDLNSDGAVDLFDLLVLVNGYGSTYDINDLIILIIEFGNGGC
jgi:hypothetical protein